MKNESVATGDFNKKATMIRGFDNALYGADGYGGKYRGGTLFRYVPLLVQ